MSEQPELKGMSIDALSALLKDWGEPAFRAKQLFFWLHQKQASDFDAMTNLPASLRERLKREALLTVFSLVRLQEAGDGTRKYLWQTPDSALVETVLMRHPYGLSACISSQVGCRMGCVFCASGIRGLERNLSAAEMLEEVYAMERQLQGERISHVVVMGMGEPLDNYEALIGFLRLIGEEKGRNLSLRNITVSTCGLVPGIYRLAKEKLPVTLALSLHAASEEKRMRLMPVASRYGIDETLRAMEAYYRETGRRVTLEYALIRGENDGPEDIRQLTGRLKGMEGSPHLNLIPVNPVAERGYAAGDARSFQLALEKNGINVTIRKEQGREIDSACGQLRLRILE